MKVNFPVLVNKKIVYGLEEMVEEINRYNGKTNLKMSLYALGSLYQGNPVWEDIYVDKLLIECTAEDCKKLSEKIKEYSIMFVDKEHFYFIFPIEPQVNQLKDVSAKWEKELNTELGINITVNCIVNKMIFVPNTLNLTTGKFVIPVEASEVSFQEELEKIAENQRLSKDVKRIIKDGSSTNSLDK